MVVKRLCIRTIAAWSCTYYVIVRLYPTEKERNYTSVLSRQFFKKENTNYLQSNKLNTYVSSTQFVFLCYGISSNDEHNLIVLTME